MHALAICLLALPLAPPVGPEVEPSGADRVRRDAEAVRPRVGTALSRAFLDAAADLPAAEPRMLYRDPKTGVVLDEAGAARMGVTDRAGLLPFWVDATGYYHTRYGSPLAYAAALEVLGKAGVEAFEGRKVLDFGYGTIGHLRLMASLGAEARGVDVDPMLPALYSDPGDQGEVARRQGPPGRVRLHHGRFPADPEVVGAIGGGYDLFLSKNTLKRGYVHPEGPADARTQLGLGVPDEAFVKAVFDLLKPGGRVLVYNLSPAPAKPGEPYRPMADGRNPFDRATWEAAGFRVVAFDADDSAAAQAIGRALGWDRGPGAMDLDAGLFARYSLLEKPAAE